MITLAASLEVLKVEDILKSLGVRYMKPKDTNSRIHLITLIDMISIVKSKVSKIN